MERKKLLILVISIFCCFWSVLSGVFVAMRSRAAKAAKAAADAEAAAKAKAEAEAKAKAKAKAEAEAKAKAKAKAEAEAKAKAEAEAKARAAAKAKAEAEARAKKMVRYVRVGRAKSHSNHWMNLAEVRVIDVKGVNVARGKRVTGSTLYHGNFPHSNLTDGNVNNFAHTHNNQNEWFEIDLGKEYEVDRVEVVNRKDCCGYRLKNTVISAGKIPNPKEKKSAALSPSAPENREGAIWTWKLPKS